MKIRIIDKIIFFIFGWKKLDEYFIETNKINVKSIIIAEKNGKIGLVLRFGYPGNLQFHPLFGEYLKNFDSAYGIAMKSIQSNTVV